MDEDDPWSTDLSDVDGTSRPGLTSRGTRGNRGASMTDLVSDNMGYHAPQEGGQSGMGACVFNFVNSIVGAGIIGLPFALKECGFFSGIFLLAAVALMVDYGVSVLIQCGRVTGKFDLTDLMEHYFGRRGFLACNLIMWVFAFGAMVAYLIIIGDTIPRVLVSWGWEGARREIVIVICATFIILPLSLLRDMSMLAWSSLLSVGADVLISIIVAATASWEAESQNITAATEVDPPYAVFRPSFAGGVGAISFAFVCHHSSFIVHNTLKNPTKHRWAIVTHTSIVMAFSLCVLLATTGYGAFLSKTEGDVLNNWDDDGGLPTMTRILLALTMVFTYPMEHFVARHVLFISLPCFKIGRSGAATGKRRPDARVSAGVSDEEGVEGVEGDGANGAVAAAASPTGGVTLEAAAEVAAPHPRMPFKLHLAVTLVQWAASVGLALIFEDLGIVLELTGSVAASALGYIFPALCFFKLHEDEARVLWRSMCGGGGGVVGWGARGGTFSKGRTCMRFLPPTLMLVFGSLLFVVGPITSIMHVVKEGAGGNATDV